MTKYSFILLKGEEKDLLEKLREVGLVDITRSTKPVDDATREMASEVELIDGLIKGLERIEIPEGTEPKETRVKEPIQIAGSLIMQYGECLGSIAAAQKEVRERAAWGSYDSSILGKLAEAGLPIHFHVLSSKSFSSSWEDALVVSSDKQNTRFIVAGEKDDLPGEIPAPKGDVNEAKEELARLEDEKKTLEQEILWAKGLIPELEALRRESLSALDLRLAGLAAVPAAEDTIVTLVGYAPSDNLEEVDATIEASGVFYLKEEADVTDNPPIKLQNNWFVRQFEVLTDMYGRPGYEGFDPTPFISIFFLLFFAFCMGDAGYGLMLLAVGFLLKKVPSFKDMAPLVMLLGGATTVIGFLFHNFFSIDISQWQVFAPVKGIFLPAQIAGNDATMILALAVGVIHICLAMVVKTIHQTRTQGLEASLGTWGWTILVVGGVIVAAFAFTGVLDADLTKWIVIVLGIVSALGIFVFNDPKRNKLANVGMGLWDTYNMITGLMGDVLSYLRLYALGLAGSMLGMAFNDMGLMVLGDGKSAILWLPFILLVVIGHTLNIAMCALGAFVHPLRLNFLEFFKNSGYEASGRSYNPLKKQ